MDPKQEGDICIQTQRKLENSLASPDKTKRERAMSLLCLWLTSQKAIKEDELTKIWKGLFYCLLHAEKTTAQEDLVKRMAFLMGKLDVELSLLFFKVFLTSLRTEWGNLDDTSLGRFQLLLRQCVSHMFAIMKKSDWELELVTNFISALAEGAPLMQSSSDAIGINVYIISAFLDELRPYLPIPAGICKVLLEPFWKALLEGCNDELAEEISSKIFFVLFDHGSRALICDVESQVSDEKAKICFGELAIDLALSIQTKTSALLTFLSHSKSVQLRLIEEKFSHLADLAQSQISTSKNVIDASSGQIDSQNTNHLAEKWDRLKTFNEQLPETHSESNQKLLFLPQTVEDVYLKKNVDRTVVDEKPTQMVTEEIKLKQGSDIGTQPERTPSKKMEANISVSEPEHNLENEQIINIDRSRVNQSIAPSDDADNNNFLAASNNGITMEDPVIMNLAKRFESIADQSPCCEIDRSTIESTPLAPSPINTCGRKRKNCKSSFASALDSESPTCAKENDSMSHDPFKEDETKSVDNLSAKKAKKVHFSLQHNIVWRPSTPLPPHDVRVPPAATPRGSALKKGVPPGPIVELIEVSISPKRKKLNTKTAPSAHLKSPKRVKNSAKIVKSTKRGCLSPR